MNKWLELAARCEAATGPDRKIDEAIFDALDDVYGFLEFTASLDAITTVIKQELPKDWQWLSGHAGDAFPGLFHALFSAPNWLDLDISVHAKTEPLARCAALCRLMAAKSPEETPETASADCK